MAEKKEGKFLQKLKGIGKFFRDCFAEIKKVVWPTPKTTFKSMGVVLLAMIIIGLFIFGLDTGFGKLLGLVMDMTA